jgi:NADH-quinone oxidoreductase subunit F
MQDDRPFHFALTGGAAGTFVDAEALDTLLTFTSARDAGVSLGSGALLIANNSVRLVDMMQNVMAFFSRESCGHCFPCRHGTLRSAETLERLAHGQGESSDLDYLHGLAQNLAEASFCGLGQGAAIPLRTGLQLLELGN